ncbi:transcriptional regulator QRICH1 isoform X1 [Lampetra planeri]
MNHSLDNAVSYEELVRLKARAIPQNRMKEFLDSLSGKSPEALQQFTSPQMYQAPGHCIYSENADVAGSLLELARPISSPLQQDGQPGGQSPQMQLQMKQQQMQCPISGLQAESPQSQTKQAHQIQLQQIREVQLSQQLTVQQVQQLQQGQAVHAQQQQQQMQQSHGSPPQGGSPPHEQTVAKVGERRPSSSGVPQPVKKRKVDMQASVSYTIAHHHQQQQQQQQQPMHNAVATVLTLPSQNQQQQQQNYIPVHQELLTVDSSQLYASNAISPSQTETWAIYTPHAGACGDAQGHTSLPQEAYSIVQVTPGQATVLGLRGPGVGADDKANQSVVSKTTQEVIHAIGTPVFASQFVNGSIQLPVAVQAGGNMYTSQATQYWEPHQQLQVRGGGWGGAAVHWATHSTLPSRASAVWSGVERETALPQAPSEQPAPPAVELGQPEPAAPPDMILDDSLKPEEGMAFWRQWAQNKNAEITKEASSKPPTRRPPLKFKEDLLSAAVAELNYGLCLIARESRRADGTPYPSDALYLLFLNIQKFMFDNGRVDNIFTDLYYMKFTEQLHEVLRDWQPKVSPLGFIIPSQITEEMLWECKQLGAHSPATLLNTLMYFNTKYFMLKTVEQHAKLAFSRVLKQTKKNPNSVKDRTASIRYLRNYGQIQAGQKITDDMYAEQPENVENPLRCPIKLYDFYLFKCPQSVKGKSDIFYLTPEPVVAPNSPIWYSAQPVGASGMEQMLARILLVREVQDAHSSAGLH